MQPVEHLWAMVPRVVRDLSTQFAKEVTLTLAGGETELDRSVLEAVKDPLTHIVRNAIDHGIEPPEVREAAGKPRAGTLSLSASHQGGQVVLEMVDDGAGIDPDRVGAKALQAGLVTAQELANMSPREVIDLVFKPGLSTATAVSNVSGRGVGMDVVRTNIERIGGTVDLLSTPGHGTTVRVKIPLTLAIIPALLVTCHGGRYAVPQAAVQELAHLDGEALAANIDQVDGALIYRLRGRLLPLVRLSDALGHPRSAEAASSLDVVVVQVDGEPFGLAVDTIEGAQEIVVKPLARHLKGLVGYAGATILGDGSVALIIDVAGLAGSADVKDGRAVAARSNADVDADRGAVTTRLLLLKVGDDRRVAIPLGGVARLEELDATCVEHAGARSAVQYRGELLPIAWLSDLLGVPSSAGAQDRLPMVVCTDGTVSVGLVADDIEDVVEAVVNPTSVGAGALVTGTAVLQGHATDLLDLVAAASCAGVRLHPVADLVATDSPSAAPAKEEPCDF
jgi:two-component system chemotaxis sensor kinase CheA